MTVDLTALDAANTKLQADTKAARSVKVYAAEATKALHGLNIAAPPSPPPSPPPSVVVQPPRPPVTDITNPTGLGLNIVGPANQTFADYTSNGTFNSAVELGPTQGGAKLSRFHLENAASIGAGPGYGRHAFYVKGPNVACEDWYVRMDPAAQDVGSGWSVRFAGFSLDRFDFAGLWFLSLFDDDPQHKDGPITISNGVAAFTDEAAILLDAQYSPAITITNAAFTGPSGLVMTVDAGSRMPSKVECHGVTINGQPVTPAAFRGVPPALLQLS